MSPPDYSSARLRPRRAGLRFTRCTNVTSGLIQLRSASESDTTFLLLPPRKAYDQKIRAELQKAKSQLAELEARSKAEDEEVAQELVNQLKSRHHQIEKKREEIATSATEEIEQEQAEINAGIAKLREGLAELDGRLNAELRKKAS